MLYFDEPAIARYMEEHGVRRDQAIRILQDRDLVVQRQKERRPLLSPRY